MEVLMTAMLLAALSTAASAQRVDAVRPCPGRVQLGYGESTADIARRCGVTQEALERFNPGLDRGKPQVGMSVTVPRPALPSPATGVTRNGFVPVPTPPGALGR
jgi:hypothetical protein